MSTVAQKRFSDEFTAALDRYVRVTTTRGNVIVGRLLAYNASDLSLWLADVKVENERTLHRLFVAGHEVSTIEIEESGPDLQKLYERINRLFPNMAKYYREAGVIVVMDRIKIGKDGVIEGSGPAAERLQKLYEEWLREEK
ncbi:MAG: Lsm family RNA-binding protein [Aigarchaeota archaeon]|nr:Lsm family RNA-binding protein [Aigarchaeota archaeon]MDW8092146.1 Lsm family RNA-binding protein [Nitrososphaerota archaeon]